MIYRAFKKTKTNLFFFSFICSYSEADSVKTMWTMTSECQGSLFLNGPSLHLLRVFGIVWKVKIVCSPFPSPPHPSSAKGAISRTKLCYWGAQDQLWAPGDQTITHTTLNGFPGAVGKGWFWTVSDEYLNIVKYLNVSQQIYSFKHIFVRFKGHKYIQPFIHNFFISF